jgi:hypothetical protein
MDIERYCNKDCAETEANMSVMLLMHNYRIQWQATAVQRRAFGLHKRRRTSRQAEGISGMFKTTYRSLKVSLMTSL